MTLQTRHRVLLAAASATVLTAFAVVWIVRGSPTVTGTTADTATADGGPTGTAPDPGTDPGETGAGVAPSTRPAPVDGLDFAGVAGLLFVDKTPGPHYGRLGFLPADPTAPRQRSEVVCDRVYAEADKLLCLRTAGSAVPSYEAVVLDADLDEEQVLELSGLPSRARLSADGAIASWTVFVSGHSYLSVGFSTQTSILDLRSGELIASLEDFAIIKDGAPYRAVDVNFWGVTVTDDNNTFYATLATGGKTYLVRGDLAARTVTTLVENVECPSLSPDNTRLVFKRRVDADGGRQPWRLHVLDLATMEQKELAETRSVDDQVAWLDDRTVAYSLPVDGITAYDLWSVPADGTGEPSLLMERGSSPTPIG